MPDSHASVTQFDDDLLELHMARLLRAGVILSAAVVFAGALVYLAHHASEPALYRVFRGQPAELRSLTGILSGIRQLHGRAIIQLGLLLLIATPVARVVFSAVAFFRQRDWLYVALTLTVLAILAASLFQGALR